MPVKREVDSSPSSLVLSLTNQNGRDSRHKRSATGAKCSQYIKKRKFELGRQSANTKLGAKRIHLVRVRGDNYKHRALRLEAGNFSWGSEGVSRKTRVLTVLRILHALVEWHLQDSAAVRTIFETVYNTTKKSDPNPLAPLPIGYDGQKRAYWQFGDSPFLWRERTHLKKGCEWEIVCRDLDELRTFANDLLDHNHPMEKALATTLLHTLIPGLEEKQAIQERKDRKEAQKLAALLEVRTLPKRERQKPARYDYNEDFLFEDDLQGEKTWTNDDDMVAPPKRQPTRSSRRLNGDQSIQLDDDELLDVE